VRYSLAGAIWLPALVLGAWRVVRETRARFPRVRLSGVSTLVLIQAPLFAAVVILIRWMGGGPERFWVGPFALSIPVAVYFGSRVARRSELIAGLGVALLIWQVYPSLRQRIGRVEAAIVSPRAHESIDGEFAGIVPRLRPGSRILLIAGQSAPDYVLFAPRDRFPNTVVPWGKRPFEARAFDRVLEESGVTHVLIENPKIVGFHWAGGLRTDPFVKALKARPDFTCEVWAADAPVLFTRKPPE
jgi:hypothetical protein